MNAVHSYPWLPWTWLLACIARIQRGNALGILEILEGICQSNFFSMDEVSWNKCFVALSFLHTIENDNSRG